MCGLSFMVWWKMRIFVINTKRHCEERAVTLGSVMQ